MGIVALLSVAFGCVDEELVIGNDRAHRACAAAIEIAAPETGCTTYTIESNSPYGCLESNGVEHAGSWVRLTRREGLVVSLGVTLRSTTSLCAPADAGPIACSASATRHLGGGTHCTCELGIVSVDPIPASGLRAYLEATEEELLLEPLGAVFDVELCASP